MAYRWVVLAVGTVAQAATATYFLGLSAVTPQLRDHYGLSLSGVGLLIGLISVGLMATLVAWGGAADRFGERGVMTVGLAGAAVALGVAAAVNHPWVAGAALLLAGAAGASVNAASGRAVLTWFPLRSRGFAMAVRQTSVPLGTGVAAVVLPVVATRLGVPAVFAVLAGGCAVAGAAVAVWIREPPDRPARGTRPPAGVRAVLADRRLLRLSLTGFLLVVPQFLGTVFLVEVLGGAGLRAGTVTTLLAVTQALGVLGRLGAGVWSDRAGRLGPLVIIALVTGAGFALAAVLVSRPVAAPAALLAAVLVPSAALALSWNGLVFTAAGELAPAGRAATAMAMTNTANYAAAATAPPVGGLLAQVAGWPAMLALGTAAALAAALVVRGLIRDVAGDPAVALR